VCVCVCVYVSVYVYMCVFVCGVCVCACVCEYVVDTYNGRGVSMGGGRGGRRVNLPTRWEDHTMLEGR